MKIRRFKGDRVRTLLAAALSTLSLVWPATAQELLTAPAAQTDSARPASDLEVPLVERVVVTATGAPAEASTTGAAITVVDRDDIDRSRATSIAELLRDVPGVDVVRAGSPGQVTSLFMRGADNREVLVLVDGVRANDPYFGGIDWAHLETSAVERIEIVRGPYSALYGSEAMGGVVQIFLRKGSGAPRVTGSLEGGDRGQKRGSLNASGSTGPLAWSLSGAYRDGDGFFPNDDYRNRSGAVTLGYGFGAGSIGVSARAFVGELGIPFQGYAPTPDRRAEARERQAAIPIEWKLGGGWRLDANFSRFEHEYRFRDPADPYGFVRSENRSERDGSRVALFGEAGEHAFAFGFDGSRERASDESNFGVGLDDERTSTRGWFVEDRWSAADGLTISAGLRKDDHSTFASTTHPRGSVAWASRGGTVRLSFAAGSAFRAPSIGELYYPFAGNRELSPERSRSAEVGLELRNGGGATATVRLFSERTDDKIDFDYVAGTYVNLRRTASKGVEVETGAPLAGPLRFALGATWLDAWDRATGLALLRRPRWRSSARLSWNGPAATGELRLLWVGRRPDLDPVTFARRDERLPSHARVDLAAAYRGSGRYGPYLRVENLLDRRYEEAAGFQAPGRSWVLGLSVVAE